MVACSIGQRRNCATGGAEKPNMRKIIEQFLRFGVVGTVGFLVDSAVLLAMMALGLGPYGGRVVSYLAAASTTFALNRAWTFRDAGRERPVATQWGRFILVNLVGFAANYGTYAALIATSSLVAENLVLGVAAAPSRALVQGAGASWRISAAAFRRELKASVALQRQLSLYLYVLMSQAVSSAGCLRFHLVGQRLARWLLMSQDRALDAQFPVTHEFLAYMLGVRRVGVTVAAGELRSRGLIGYHRGKLTVLDRPGLEAAACSCYAADRRVYARYLGE